MDKADYSNLFKDERLSKRGKRLLHSLFVTPNNSIQQIARTRAEQKGYYRFLNSKKVDEEMLSDEIGMRCGRAVEGKVVLCIQDTTEVNLFRHTNRLKSDSGFGPVDASAHKGIGFKVHPCVVVDAHTCFPYGFAGIDIWHRPPEPSPAYHRARKLPIEERESGKWIRGNERAVKYLDAAKTVVIVQDREGDIYEQFCSDELKDNQFLLIRSRCNRGLSDDTKIWDRVSSQSLLGTYTITVEADSHKKTRRREALMEIRVVQVHLKRPDKKRADVPPLSKEVFVIEAKEVTPGIQDPICWRLLTTLPVSTLEDAQQVVEWYTWRWMIEEVFRVLKKECYNIEGSELESAWAIRKLTMMILDTSIKLFQMHIAYQQEEGGNIAADSMFEKEEIECLKKINKKMEGKTKKLSNSSSVDNLKGITWIIARLGGWKGFASQRKPGATTLLIGLAKFYTMFEGHLLEKDVGTR